MCVGIKIEFWPNSINFNRKSRFYEFLEQIPPQRQWFASLSSSLCAVVNLTTASEMIKLHCAIWFFNKSLAMAEHMFQCNKTPMTQSRVNAWQPRIIHWNVITACCSIDSSIHSCKQRRCCQRMAFIDRTISGLLIFKVKRFKMVDRLMARCHWHFFIKNKLNHHLVNFWESICLFARTHAVA